MITAIMADDELPARQALRYMLREETAITLIGECGTAAELIDLVRQEKPELLFVGLRMAGSNAFELLAELASDLSLQMPSVIFTAACDSYALRAFEVHAADYLLKPFTSERLKVAVQRAVLQIHARQAPQPNFKPDENSLSYAKRIVFKSKGRILFLPVSSIRWIGAEENYVRICTDDESYLLREPIGRLEEKLDPQTFLRTHRSCIVNLQFIKEIRTETAGESAVILLNGKRLPMSRSYRARINEWLERCRGLDSRQNVIV